MEVSKMKKSAKITDNRRIPLFVLGLLFASFLVVSCGGGGYGGGGGGMASTSPPGAFSLMSPSVADMAMMVGTTPTFAWGVSANASDYRVEVDTTGTFSGPFVINRTVGIVNSYTVLTTDGLMPGTMYHWRIVAENIYGQAVAGPRTFTP
jgi:hypothetical protein